MIHRATLEELIAQHRTPPLLCAALQPAPCSNGSSPQLGSGRSRALLRAMHRANPLHSYFLHEKPTQTLLLGEISCPPCFHNHPSLLPRTFEAEQKTALQNFPSDCALFNYMLQAVLP